MIQRSDNHEWLIRRAKRYAQHRNTAGVIDVSQRLLQDLPDDTVALALLGAALFQAGRPAEAIDAYTRALDVDPDLVLIRYQLGLAQAALARHDEALTSWQPLLDDDEDYMAHYQSALALLATGRPVEAAPLVAMAHKRMPRDHLLCGELDKLASRFVPPSTTVQ